MAIRRFKSRATAGRKLKAGTLAQLTSAADIVTTAERGDGVAGTYHAPEASEVQKGATVGATVGTLVGIVDSAGARTDYGACSSAQVRTATGIVHTSGTVESWGTLSSAAAYNATGVIYGAGSYATEASRNSTTAAAGDIVTGKSVTIAGSTTNGSLDLSLYTLTSTVVSTIDAAKAGILSSVTLYTVTGTYHAPDAEEVIKTAVFGPASEISGTYPTTEETVIVLLAADKNYLNTHKDEMIAANDDIRARFDCDAGTATVESHTANQVLKSAGGNYNDDNLTDANVRPVAYGLGATGDLSGLLATDAAYVSLENTRNNDNGTVAGEILTTKTVKIRNSTYTGTLTLADSTYVLSTAPDYGIAGTGGAKTATLTAAGNVLTGTGVFGIGGTSVTPSYSPDFPDVGNVTTTDTVNGSQGTLNLSLYVLISNVVSAAYVVTGNSNYVGGDAGTYPTTATSQAAQLATDQGVVLAAAASIKNDTTILGQAGTYDFMGAIAAGYASGEAAQLVADQATVLASAEWIVSGHSILGQAGTFDLDAYEAGRNSDPGVANVVDGVTYEIFNVAKVGIYAGGVGYTYGSNDPQYVLTSAGAGAGTFDASSLSVGNVIQGVAFGVGLTGTGANLLATHTTFLSLEAGRNSTTATAGDIVTGHSVTIAGATTAGTLNLASYCLIAGITWPALDEVDGGVHFGPTTGLEYEGTGVNATTVAAAILATPANKLATDASGNVTPTAASKTGYALAATGLDAIPITAPTGPATTFREAVVQTWRRFFKRATKTSSQIKTYADNGTTVVTTQAVSDDATTEVQGDAN